MSTSFFYSIVGGVFMLSVLSDLSYANDEVDALLDVKKMLRDPQNVMGSWDSSWDTPCTWFHITCDNNERVTRIDLLLSELSGPLSPRIGDLPNLQHLQIYSNSLTGTLPASLGNLKNLITLRLSGNKLSGVIPTSIGQLSNLKYLDLKDNLLSGQIPHSLTAISLMTLDLSNNRLSGPVPESLSKFGYEKFKGNPGLCGSVVRKPCSRS